MEPSRPQPREFLGARRLVGCGGGSSPSRPGFLKALVLLLVMILVGRVMYQTYMFLYINFVDPTWVDTVAEVWSGRSRRTLW